MCAFTLANTVVPANVAASTSDHTITKQAEELSSSWLCVLHNWRGAAATVKVAKAN